MTTGPFADALPATVRHYLDRIGHVLDLLAREEDPGPLLAVRLAPDAFDTALNLAVAIGFAGRALCPPAGLACPAMPDELSLGSLRSFRDETARVLAPIAAADLTRRVSHLAGEARLDQEAADYAVRFALPNMIFHLTMAYAGLRHGGMRLGKADFDGLHRY